MPNIQCQNSKQFGDCDLINTNALSIVTLSLRAKRSNLIFWGDYFVAPLLVMTHYLLRLY